MARTYLLEDVNTKEIAGYFTLRTGLITVKQGFFQRINITGIELANFAVNDAYREIHNEVPKLGRYIFIQFILPLVKEISQYVGAAYLYIFALPHDRLMAHYASMGFTRANKRTERFVQRTVKPTYDRGCIFMAQKIK